MDHLLEWFSSIAPDRRRKVALWTLLVTFVLGHINIAAFVFGVVSPALMDAITNYLSWLALTITALDVLIGTDVRLQQED